jgi:hypothetical protein
VVLHSSTKEIVMWKVKDAMTGCIKLVEVLEEQWFKTHLEQEM